MLNILRKQKNLFDGRKGFTLIELIIVISIVSLITTALITIFNPGEQLSKGNDTRRKSDLSQIQKALEQYYDDNGKYPLSDNSYQIIGADGNPVAWGGGWTPYMNTLPLDPTKRGYVYFSSDGQSYFLYASLERGTKDPKACKGNQGCSSLTQNSIPYNACGGTCNYAITSPNVSP